MNVDQLVKHYGSQMKAADRIGVSDKLISKWKVNEMTIPIEYQIAWELDSRGELRADLPKRIRTAA